MGYHQLMTSLDVLYYALALGFLVLVGFISYMAYEAALTLKSLRGTLGHVDNIVSNVDDLTTDVGNLKNQLKLGYWSLIGKVMSLFAGRGKRGGERNG